MRIEEQELGELIETFEFFIKEKQDTRLKHLLVDIHPSDVADIINRIDNIDDRLYLFKLLNNEVASDTIMRIDEAIREDLVVELEKKEITDLVSEMDSDDAADFVSELSEDLAKDVLSGVEKEDAAEVKELMKHREDTAGGIMALEIVAVNKDSTVDEAIQEIRRKAEEVEDLYNVYVVDNNNVLVGLVSVKSLILASGNTKIEQIMERDVPSVDVDMDQEHVANVARRYDMVSIPVTDEQNRLLGRITIDDIVDVMEEEAAEDIQRMAGITDEEELREPSSLRIVRGRIPWLITGLFGGIFGAIVIHQFEASLAAVTSLALFIPVILAMGGNVGMQSSAIIVRGLAIGEIDFEDIFKRLFKEIKVSIINGVLLAILLFSVIIIGFQDMSYIIAGVVGGALLTVILIAGIVGTTIPLILKKMNIDPALATGPFITTSNDIIALLIYFLMATFFLGLQ